MCNDILARGCAWFDTEKIGSQLKNVSRGVGDLDTLVGDSYLNP